MARRRSASVPRKHSSLGKPLGGRHPYGLPVPPALHEAIETERQNLSKADSVLRCLVISMQHEPDVANGPYYPDVAEIARDLVRQAVNRLDSLTLEKRLLRNRVKESVLCNAYARGSAPTSVVPQEENSVLVERLYPAPQQREACPCQ
jgi:hypothetical protein